MMVRAPTLRPVFRARGPCTIRSALFTPGADVAKDVANFWTISLYRRTGTESPGTRVGKYSTATLRLQANLVVELLDGALAIDLADGEDLLLGIVATGTPGPLVAAALDLVRARKR